MYLSFSLAGEKEPKERKLVSKRKRMNERERREYRERKREKGERLMFEGYRDKKVLHEKR